MVLEIITNPNPILKKKVKPVKVIDKNIKKIIKDMLDTMYAKKGIGLAANQVGFDLSIITMDISEAKNEPLFLINPKITYKSKEKDILVEGCLSVPGFEAEVERYSTIKIKAFNLKQELAINGFLARVIQHEMDHLNGILYIDRLSRDTKLCPTKS